jgi:hypothetical protein
MPNSPVVQTLTLGQLSSQPAQHRRVPAAATRDDHLGQLKLKRRIRQQEPDPDVRGKPRGRRSAREYWALRCCCDC